MQQAPPRPLVRRGGGSRQAKRGMEKREALEVHRGRNKNDKSQIIMKKHENFIKKMHERRLRLSQMNRNQMPCFSYGKM